VTDDKNQPTNVVPFPAPMRMEAPRQAHQANDDSAVDPKIAALAETIVPSSDPRPPLSAAEYNSARSALELLDDSRSALDLLRDSEPPKKP
jgi:hypothetical protein